MSRTRIEIAREPFHGCNCAEREALRELATEFADAMYNKLAKQLDENIVGWSTPRGWDAANEREAVDAIAERLRDHIPDSPDNEPRQEWDPVDVANFAAFAWNMRLPKEPPDA